MTAWTSEHVGQIRSQLERVAAGGAFSTSGRMPALLRHLVEAELQRRRAPPQPDEPRDRCLQSRSEFRSGRRFHRPRGNGPTQEQAARVLHHRRGQAIWWFSPCRRAATRYPSTSEPTRRLPRHSLRPEAGVTFLLGQGRYDDRVRDLRRRLSTGEGGELVEPPGIRLPESHLAPLVGRTGRALSRDPLRRARLRAVGLGCRGHLFRSLGSTISVEVVDTAAPEKFALYGMSQGVPVAVAYAGAFSGAGQSPDLCTAVRCAAP